MNSTTLSQFSYHQLGRCGIIQSEFAWFTYLTVRKQYCYFGGKTQRNRSPTAFHKDHAWGLLFTLYYIHSLLYSLSIIFTLYYIHSLLYSLSIIFTLYYIHSLLYSLSIIFTLYTNMDADGISISASYKNRLQLQK